MNHCWQANRQKSKRSTFVLSQDPQESLPHRVVGLSSQLKSILRLFSKCMTPWRKFGSNFSLEPLINPSHLAQSAEDSNRPLTSISVTVWKSKSTDASKWPSLNSILTHELYLNPQLEKIWWMLSMVIHLIEPTFGMPQRRIFHRVSCPQSSPIMRGHQIGGITSLVGLSWSQMPFEFSNMYVRAIWAKEQRWDENAWRSGKHSFEFRDIHFTVCSKFSQRQCSRDALGNDWGNHSWIFYPSNEEQT